MRADGRGVMNSVSHVTLTLTLTLTLPLTLPLPLPHELCQPRDFDET